RRWKLQHAMEDVANRTSPGFGAPQLLVARRRSFRPRLWEWSFKPSLARQAARWVGVEPVGIELFAEPDVKDSRHDCVAAVLPMAMRLMRARHRGGHAFKSLVSIGILRRRLPVAAKIALATAGTIAEVPGSPIPPGASLFWMRWTSIAVGASSMRSTW